MAGKAGLYSDVMDSDISTVGDRSTLELFNPRKNLMDIEEFSTSSLTNIDVGQERMKVYLRIRPFTTSEQEKRENQGCLVVQDCQSVVANAPKDSHTYKNTIHGIGKTSYQYTFSRIFKDATTQKEFFNDTMLNMVKDCIDGQNCLVFTYGITSSGKTYTIQGEPSDAGILPRALDVLFNSISGKQWPGMNIKPKMFMDVEKLSPEQETLEKLKKDNIFKLSCEDDPDVNTLLGEDASDMSHVTNSTTSSETSNTSFPKESGENSNDLFADLMNRVREETAVNVEDQGQIKFSVWVSFAEIYNEQIFDLLESVPRKKNSRRPTLKLSDDKNGSPFIKGLKEIQVSSADEAYRLLSIGQRNLSTACTKLNHQSSRSHCIFNIKILRVVDNGNPQHARVSMLSLCDLAGSERHNKTQSQGDRLKEANNINTSLLTLGRCIETLRYNQNHKEHPKIIPFRDSKLTRLFQNFFCGRGKAAMVVNVNQLASMFDETLCVFKFSAIAKQLVVVQKPVPRPKLFLSDDARSSISWDTSGVTRKMSSDMDAAQQLPLPEDDDDLDETMYAKSDVEELIKLAQNLEEQLEQEQNDKLILETRIRKQVCKEMGQQLVEIEDACSERIRVREQMAEEMADERIKILMEAYEGQSKSRKRPNLDNDNDDEWVSSILLHREKVKVQKQDGEISQLQSEMELLKSRVKELQETNCEMKKAREEIQNKQDKDVDTENAVLETLSKQLQDARDQLKEQEKEICDLNEMLTEAGETFQQKEEKIEKLKYMISQDEDKIKHQEDTMRDLQKMLENSEQAMNSADERLTRKEQLVTDLELEVNNLKDKLRTSKNSQVFTENITKEKEKEFISMRSRLKREEDESFQREQALIHGFKEEIENYKTQITRLKTQLMGAKHGTVLSPKKHVGSPIKNRGENSDFNYDLLQQIKALQADLNENSSGSVKLEQALTIARSSTEELGKLLAVESEGHKNAKIHIEKIEKELEDVRVGHADKTGKKIEPYEQDVEKLIESRDLEIKTLIDEINELEKKLSRQDLKHSDMEDKHKELGLVVASEIDELKVKMSSSETLIKELRGERTTKDVVIGKLEQSLEEQKTLNAGLRDIINKTTDDIELKDKEIKNLSSALLVSDKLQKFTDVPNSINALQKAMKEMRTKYEHAVDIAEERQKEIEKLKIEVDELHIICSEKDANLTFRMDDKYRDVEFQLEEKLIEFQDLKEQLKASNVKMESMERDMNELKEGNIKDKNSQIRQQMEEIEMCKQELEEKELSIEEREMEISTYKTTVNCKNSELETLKEKVQDDENEIMKYEEACSKTVKEMKAAVVKLELDLASKEQVIVETKKETKASLLKFELELHNKEQELIECKKIAEEAEAISESLCERAMKAEETLNSFRNTFEKTIMDGSDSKQAQDLEVKEKQYTESLEKIENIENQLLSVQAKLDSKTEQYRNLELRHQTLQKELTIKEEEINKVTQALQDKNNKCQQLQNSISKLELQQSVNEKHSEDGIKDLLGNVKNLNSKISVLELDLTSTNIQIKDGAEQYDGLEQELCSKELQLSKLEGEMVTQTKELQKMTVCYEEIECNLKSRDEQTSSMNEASLQIAELKSTLHTYRALHQSSKEEVHARTEEVHAKTVEFDKLQVQYRLLQDELKEAIEKLEKRSTELEYYSTEKNELSQSKEEILVLKQKLSDSESTINKLEQSLTEMESEKKNREEDIANELAQKMKNIEDLQQSLTEMECEKKNRQKNIVDEHAQKARDMVDMHKSLENVTKENDAKEEQLAKLEVEVISLKNDLVEKENFVIKLEKSVKTLTSELNSNHDDIAKNEKEISNFKTLELKNNDSLENKVAELEKCLADEREQCKEYCNRLELMKIADCTSPEGQISSTARKLRKEKIEIENKLIEAKWTIENLGKKVKDLQDSQRPDDVEKSDTTREFQIRLETLTAAVAEKDENNRNCIHDIAQYQTKIEALENELAESKSSLSIKEMELETVSVNVERCETQRASIASPSVQGELNRSQKREETLRQQLKGAHSTVQELNKRVDQLEEKLKVKTNMLEQLEQDSKELKTKLVDMEETGRKELADVEKKLDEAREELIRKDKKLSTKKTTLKEMHQTIEFDQDRFIVALKDAKANEMVIENLKSILNEQEETMETQDKVLLARDGEIQTLQSELARERDQSSQMIEASGTSGREMRDLYMCNAHLEAEKIHTTRSLQEKEVAFQKLMDEKEKLQNDQHSSVKKIMDEKESLLKEKDDVIKQLSDEIEKLMSDQDELVEKLKIDNGKLVKERDSWSEKINTERDKLLHDQYSLVKQLTIENQRMSEENRVFADKLDNEKKRSCTESTMNRNLEQKINEQDDCIRKMTEEKEKLDIIMNKNNQELKDLEKSLMDSCQGCKQLRETMEKEIKQQVTDLREGREETIQELKTKLREREHKLSELHRELNSLNSTLQDNEIKMNKWRDERDKLVSDLETVLKKQQEELKTLKEERKSAWHQSEHTLSSQDESDFHLPDSTEVCEDRASQSKSSKRIKHCQVKDTSLVKIPVSARQTRKRTVSTASSEDGNKTSATRENQIETSFGVDDADVASHIQIDATPPVAAKNLRKSRKSRHHRSLIDVLGKEKVEKENRPKRGAKSRACGRIKNVVTAIQSSPVTRSGDESVQQAPAPAHITRKQSSLLKASSAAKRVLGSITKTISPSRVASSTDSAASASLSSPPQTINDSDVKEGKSKRRKHQLYKEEVLISAPMDCVSFVQSSGTEVHGIVKKQLRGRKH